MTRALAMLLALSLAPSVSVAAAQDGREAFVAGTQALEENRLDGARQLFEQAYAESGNPAALFNVARTLLATGRYVDAIAAVDRLLEAHPDLSAELRDPAVETRDQARARLARIVLIFEPPTPALRLDGREARPEGEPPTLALDPGTHYLVASRDGAAPFRWEGELAAGEVRPLRLDLDAPDSTSGGEVWPWLVAGGALLVVAAAVAIGVAIALDAQLSPRHERVLRP